MTPRTPAQLRSLVLDRTCAPRRRADVDSGNKHMQERRHNWSGKDTQRAVCLRQFFWFLLNNQHRTPAREGERARSWVRFTSWVERRACSDAKRLPPKASSSRSATTVPMDGSGSDSAAASSLAGAASAGATPYSTATDSTARDCKYSSATP